MGLFTLLLLSDVGGISQNCWTGFDDEDGRTSPAGSDRWLKTVASLRRGLGQ